MKFNLSYSSLSLYRESPRSFYYQYIRKIRAPDDINQSYGKAGNVVHKYLENYINGINQEDFSTQWMKEGLNDEPGFNDEPLSLSVYKKCADSGVKIVDIYKEIGYKLETEVKFQFEYEPGIFIKGFVDVKAIKEDKIIIFDWKTDSSTEKDKHKEQRLFYAWAYWKEYKSIPKSCIWYYLKLDREDKNSFTLKEIEEFDNEINNIIDDIKQKGMVEENYPLGDYKNNPFNGYKSLLDKVPVSKTPLIITIKNAQLHLKGEPLTEELKQYLIKEFSYELKDAFFVKRNMGKRGVKFDGFKRFYSYNKDILPIGFLNRLKNILENKKINYVIIDERAELKEYKMPDELKDIELRDYQKEAVEFAMNNKITFLEIATSGGKTAIAAEIIRRNKGLSLFIVDRGILLEQTKRVFERVIGEKIGTITEGSINLGIINVATIQTLNSLLDKKDKTLIKLLSNIKTVFFDEGHTVAGKTFMRVSNYITNADIRIGMSGTFNRPDGNDMMIESVAGRNEFKISAEKLIEDNFIMKPRIWFLKIKEDYKIEGGEYNEVYIDMIVNNKNRNDTIKNFVNRMSNKTILIIVHKIVHGELLQNSIEGSVFIKGDVSKEQREGWISDMKEGRLRVMIGTSSIIGKGLDIPNLDVLINATGNASSIITIQSLGRILRAHKGKEMPIYVDFLDRGRYLRDHSSERMEILKKQGHDIKIFEEKN